MPTPKTKDKPRRKREDLPYEEQLKAGFLHGAKNIGRYLGLLPKKVYRWVEDGRLPSVRHAGREIYATTKGLDRDMNEFPVIKAQFAELWSRLDHEDRSEVLAMYG
jgi:hypothetical protein